MQAYGDAQDFWSWPELCLEDRRFRFRTGILISSANVLELHGDAVGARLRDYFSFRRGVVPSG